MAPAVQQNDLYDHPLHVRTAIMIEVSGGGKDCTSHKRGILSRARISASDREHSEIITELLPTTAYVPLARCIFSLVLSKRMLLTEEVD